LLAQAALLSGLANTCVTSLAKAFGTLLEALKLLELGGGMDSYDGVFVTGGTICEELIGNGVQA